MLNKIRDLFRVTESKVDEIDPALAAAALMFEVVWADHDVADAELEQMIERLESLFELDRTKVDHLVQTTRSNQDANVGVFPFTRALNEQLNAEEKYQVLKAMWSIALADTHIDAFEEHTIRRIADLLYIPHQRFIEAKLAARAELELGQ